jgi:hypothetical protein
MLLFFVRRMLSVRRLAAIGAIFVCFVFPANTVRAQRSIPEDNLAYPVLIEVPGELASGFYLNTNTSMYLVTAKHIIFDPQTGRVRSGPMTLLSYPRDPKESGTNVILVDMAALWQAGEIKGHPTADVAVVRISDFVKSAPDKDHPGAQATRFIPGIAVRTAAPSGFLGVDIKALRKYEEVLVANNVLLFGYPTSLGIPELPQLDPLRPLLRSGIVAGLNPNGKSIIIDCPSYPGNSGGPVVEADRTAFSATFNVIGVVSQFVPFEEKSINYPIAYQNVNISNSGYTIVTPMDFVLELVK